MTENNTIQANITIEENNTAQWEMYPYTPNPTPHPPSSSLQPPSETEVFAVFEVTAHIKSLLENSIGTISIKGEISNLSTPSSGHYYFSLKDSKAQIKCVFFSFVNKYLNFAPKNGDIVIATGQITVYEQGGQYQLNVKQMIPFGKDGLLAQYEQLKERLQKEGLFDTRHKRPLPRYPQTIGIVTSETGAALQDMLNIISRRYPSQIELYPATVQGTDAPRTLIAGIRYFSISAVDVVIIGRGGGSFEDLFCFNDEQLVREIYNCPKPVISAVGHETDFTLCDFVADKRASTPSEAAELVVPDIAHLHKTLQNQQNQLTQHVQNLLYKYIQHLYLKKMALKEACDTDYTHTMQKRIDTAKMRLKTLTDMIKDRHTDFYHKKTIYDHINLASLINAKHSQLTQAQTQLTTIINKTLTSFQQHLQKNKELLEIQNPKHILGRGFTYIEKDGQVICSKNDIKIDDDISITFKDGKCNATVKE